MSTRRGFLKKALIVIAASTVAPTVLIRATEHIQKYHPEVQAVFDRFPVKLDYTSKQTIAKFILAEMESENWEKIDSFFHFGMKDEANAIVNWKE